MGIIKNIIKVVFRDFKQLNKKYLPINFRLFYPFKKYFSIIQNLITKKKQIFYFNNKFEYDNWATPISLQSYPYDIKYKILNNLDVNLQKILDIGANIGQFAITLSQFAPDAKFFCFEPNPIAYKLLKKNTCYYKNINIYNLGIGENKKSNLYYSVNKSATASLFIGNSHYENQKILTTEIHLSNEIDKITTVNKFDLIKIDVEGYEFEVIKNLSIKTKYLFIEISGNRQRNYKHSEIYKLIENKLGQFDIIYQDAFKSEGNNFEVLLKFIEEFQEDAFNYTKHKHCRE